MAVDLSKSTTNGPLNYVVSPVVSPVGGGADIVDGVVAMGESRFTTVFDLILAMDRSSSTVSLGSGRGGRCGGFLFLVYLFGLLVCTK